MNVTSTAWDESLSPGDPAGLVVQEQYVEPDWELPLQALLEKPGADVKELVTDLGELGRTAAQNGQGYQAWQAAYWLGIIGVHSLTGDRENHPEPAGKYPFSAGSWDGNVGATNSLRFPELSLGIVGNGPPYSRGDDLAILKAADSLVQLGIASERAGLTEVVFQSARSLLMILTMAAWEDKFQLQQEIVVRMDKLADELGRDLIQLAFQCGMRPEARSMGKLMYVESSDLFNR